MAERSLITVRSQTISESSQPPTVDELLLILNKLVKWELVAAHLRGMEYDEIEKISLKSSDVEQRKRLCFNTWLSLCSNPSWDDVVTALEKGKEKTLAETVRKRKSSKAITMQPSPSVTKEFMFEESEEEKIINELQELHDLFTPILLQVQDKIQEKVNKNELTLSQISIQVQATNPRRLGKITNCSTVDELNINLTHKCSFLDGSILHRIVKFVLPENDSLLTGATQHMEKAKDFRKNASIKELKDKIHETIKAATFQAPLSLVVKLNNVWDRTTIDNVTMLIEYLADNEDIGPRLVKVVSSSVEVTLLISEDHKACFNVITQQKEQFMCLTGLFHLQVEESIIFHEKENPNYTFENGLLKAAEIGHVQAIEVILSIDIDVDYQNDEGKTALILASENGHSETVKLLLFAGASVDKQDNIGQTAVMVAKTVDIYQTLVEAKADTNIVTHRGSTPLIASCILGNHDVANYLLFTLKHDITTRPDNVTLLMAASERANNTIVEYLVKNGHNPNVQNNEGRTALIQASHHGHNETVELLLLYGAEPDIQDKDGRTAIQLSCLNGHYTVTKTLLKHNADPSIPSNNGWTPLTNASQEGHHEIVKLLLHKKLNPNRKNIRNGRTALIQASQNGHNETVKLLLFYGAEPDIQDNDGRTAIQLSCFSGHYTVTEILISYDANPSLPDNKGFTPIKQAMHSGLDKIFKLLQDSMEENTEANTLAISEI